ncbi:MAG TPA: 2-dehydropantoate 2-reductase [Candidatus Limnocylindrales bacterium]|nr:2-dehydropantoate 2-reductase [Candidatus Limnocylindrales bacterium]
MAKSIGIVGGGALGTLLASRLLATGADVRVVARSGSRHEALKRNHPSLRTGSEFELVSDVEVVFLCVKAYHTRDVARSLAALGLKETTVCSLQNGWGHMEHLDQTLPHLPLLAGATSLGAYLDEGGSLHATERGTTVLAPWRPDDLRRAERAADLLRSGAGLNVEVRPNARAVLWRKLVLNSAVNPVTALARCTNGVLLQEPALFEIARQAAREAARVGRKLGVLDPDFDPDEALAAILRETAANLSSMREDLSRGRRTEVEEITGSVVRLAGEAGVPAPVQGALLTLMRAAERRL